jgi:hypothetical protein
MNVVVHLSERRTVVILYWLHHPEACLQKRGRYVAEGVDQCIDVEVIRVGQYVTSDSSPDSEVDGGRHDGDVLTMSGLRAVKIVDMVPLH